MEDILARLNDVPLFASLSEINKHRLAEIIRRASVPRGTTLVEQGDMGTTLFIVDAGLVVATAVDERGELTKPRLLQPGDWWGETSLLVGEPRDATMQTVEDTELFFLYKADFTQLVEQHPSCWNELNVSDDVYLKITAPQFPWLNADERVEWYGKKHWMALLRKLVRMLALYAVATVVIWIFASIVLNWLMWPVMAALLLLLSPFFVWEYVDWSNDFYVVTNLRVVHIEDELFNRQTRTEAPLGQVQNIDVRQEFLGNLLDYAMLQLVTASAKAGRVSFEWVCNPDLVRRTVVEQMRRAFIQRRSVDMGHIKELLDARLRFDDSQIPEVPADVEPDEPKKKRRDPLSLLARTKGASRIYRDTALWSFFSKPHLPRLGVIMEQDGSIIWRKHWLLLLRAIFVPSLVVSASFFLFAYELALSDWGKPDWVLLWLTLIVSGVSFFWLFYKYEDWRNDLYVVTHTDIIDIERTPFLAKESRRQAGLDRIQDVHSEVPTLLASIAQMGDVIIETAGQGELTFVHVRNPNAVQDQIFLRMEALRQRRREAERRQREAEIIDWFDVYHDEFREDELDVKRGKRRLFL